MQQNEDWSPVLLSVLSHLLLYECLNSAAPPQGREELKLMNVTLDIYMRIFSSILHHQHKTGTPALLDQVPDSERSKVKEDLKVIRGKMEALKRHLNHPSHDREDVISKLNMIKVRGACLPPSVTTDFVSLISFSLCTSGWSVMFLFFLLKKWKLSLLFFWRVGVRDLCSVTFVSCFSCICFNLQKSSYLTAA